MKPLPDRVYVESTPALERGQTEAWERQSKFTLRLKLHTKFLDPGYQGYCHCNINLLPLPFEMNILIMVVYILFKIYSHLCHLSDAEISVLQFQSMPQKPFTDLGQ